MAQTAVPPHWVAGRARNGVAESRLLDGPPSLCYWRRGTGVGEGVRRGPRTKGSVRPETCHRQGFHRATQSLAVWGHSRDRSQVVPARAPSGRLRNFGHGSPPRKKKSGGPAIVAGGAGRGATGRDQPSHTRGRAEDRPARCGWLETSGLDVPTPSVVRTAEPPSVSHSACEAHGPARRGKALATPPITGKAGTWQARMIEERLPPTAVGCHSWVTKQVRQRDPPPAHPRWTCTNVLLLGLSYWLDYWSERAAFSQMSDSGSTGLTIIAGGLERF